MDEGNLSAKFSILGPMEGQLYLKFYENFSVSFTELRHLDRGVIVYGNIYYNVA